MPEGVMDIVCHDADGPRHSCRAGFRAMPARLVDIGRRTPSMGHGLDFDRRRGFRIGASTPGDGTFDA